MSRIIIIALALILAGCNSVPDVPEPEKTYIHPELPQPVGPYSFNWRVLEQENRAYVGLSYDESLEFRMYLEDLLRYVREMNEVACYYRKELDDARCGTKSRLLNEVETIKDN